MNKPELRKQKPDLSSLIYGKVPPQALKLEEAVLGAIMLDRAKLDEVAAIIRSPDCFYSDSNQKIYAAILRLLAKNEPVDLLTVPNELTKANELELAGGIHAIMLLTGKSLPNAQVAAHARMVMEKFFLREIIRICGGAISKGYDNSEDPFDILDEIQVDLCSITEHIKSGNLKRIGASLIPTIDAMKISAGNHSEMLGMSTGITKLDNITLGITAPDLIVIAAGTGEGKTTFAINIAEQMAIDGNAGVFFSLEMKDRQLIWKVLSSHIQEDIKTIRGGKIGSEKWKRLTDHVAPLISKMPIYLYDVGGLNIIELKSIARTAKKKYNIKWAMIDYIQLVRGAGKKFGTREEEVNFVSKELKSLAMELEIPIIALSQLNRIEKSNAKRMYMLSDLRESGALEQDADGVIFIYRPFKHDLTDMEIAGQKMSFTELDGLVDIAKWRLGEVGTFRIKFDGKYNKFSDYQDPQHFENPTSPAIKNHIYAGYQKPNSQRFEND